MSNSTNTFPWTELDKKSFHGPSQMLKAAASYMDPASGKMLAMLARMLEFRQTMTVFEEEQLSICSVPNNNRPGIEDILKDIRKYCAPAEVEQIDQFLNMFNAVRLYNQYSEFTKNTDISGMMNQINQMKNMNNLNMNISPEQIQMLQSLLHAQSAGSGKDNS